MSEYLHLYNDDVDYDLRGSTYHVTDGGWVPATMVMGPDLARATVVDSIELNVMASTAAGVEDAIEDLRVLLREAARRYMMERYPTTSTYLRRYPDGGSAADYRTAEVVGGRVQRQSVIGMRTAQADSAEFCAVVVLEVDRLVALGVEETLENLVPTCSFEYDTDSDGLADDWTETGDAAAQTASIVEVTNDYGRYGQRLQYAGATANTGIRTANITVVAETSYTFKAWVDNNCTSETVRVRVYDQSNGAWITDSNLSWTASETESLKSVDFDTPAGCVAVRVYGYVLSPAGTVDWIVDAVYLGLTGDYSPQGWSSYHQIKNHEDGAAVSTDRNWVLVADIPGEVEAVVENVLEVVSGMTNGLEALVASRRVDDLVWRAPLWLQAESMTLTAGSLDTDAGASGPAANNCVDHTLAIGSYTAPGYWRETTTAVLKALRGKYRVFAVVTLNAGSDAALYFRLNTLIGINHYSDAVYVTVDNSQWQWIRGPVVAFPPSGAMELHDEDFMDLYPQFNGTTTDELRLDAILLMPIDEEYGDVPDYEGALSAAASDLLAIGGKDELAWMYDDSLSQRLFPVPDEGLVSHLMPGRSQRLAYLVGGIIGGGDEQHPWDRDATFYVELEYRPRYLSL